MVEMDKKSKELFLRLVLENSLLKEQEKKRKKKKSEYNKRYYQKHRDEILQKNQEMRNIYKIVKQR